jgi:predicted  nucleic acid-binding Zn-ribbon protein
LQLREMLTIVAVPGTDLLELRAEGKDPLQLAQLVNLWPEAYETRRRQDFDPAVREQIAAAEEALGSLRNQTDAAEAALRAFREANDMSALRQEEQDVAGKREQLERQLNKAERELEDAEKHKARQQDAIIAGETVAPREQERAIGQMRRDLARMQALLDDFLEQYTPAFVERDPKVRELPAEIEAKQREIEQAVRDGRNAVLADADNEIAAAQAVVADLQRQLAALDGPTGDADSKALQLQSLENELSQLERAQAEKHAELSRLRGGRLQALPPVQLVSRAETPTRPVHPKYERDALFAIALALGLAFLVTWIAEYLGNRRTAAGQVSIDGPGAAAGRPSSRADSVAPDDMEATPGYPGQSSRELAGTEVQALLAGCDATVTGYAALLLSGVSPYELPLLHAACFDPSRRSIAVPGAAAREFPLGDRSWSLVEAVIGDMDEARMPLTVAELDERLRNAANQAALSAPQAISALTLWHTYVVFLVRQGISPAALQARVGTVPPSMLEAINHLAPVGKDGASDMIEFTYPVLA